MNSDYTINYEQAKAHGEMKCISSIIVKKLQGKRNKIKLPSDQVGTKRI